MNDKTKENIKLFLIAIAIPLAVGGFSAFLTRNNMQIYQEVKTPPLSPPGFLFPIVWTVLYVLMGISSALVWKNRLNDTKSAAAGLMIYAVSLLFNFGWSIFFFNCRWFFFSFIWLLVLLFLIILTIVTYNKVSPLAAILQIPYMLWVAFAGYLNAGIFVLSLN